MELRLFQLTNSVIILLVIIVSLPDASKAFSQSAEKDIVYANFKVRTSSYLNITRIGADLVQDSIDCAFACLEIRSCFSYNLAALSDNNRKLLCEPLPSDKYNNSDKFVASQLHHHYSIMSPCSDLPCKNSGTCVPQYDKNSYVCVCTKEYTGKNCQTVIAKSCSDLKKLDPKAVNGNYVIDPDGEGGLPPLYDVTCDMSDKNGVGVTVISHDSENRTLVDGFEDPGSYSRDIHYTGANLSQLAGLTNVSSHCEQFIKYECKDSLLLHGNHAWWVSRDSANMTYWGGADPGSGKCACGMNNSCANPLRACNCDKNDLVWREDSGLLTDKTYLPVKQLRFGDTSDGSEKGYHTLGKLKCYGIA